MTRSISSTHHPDHVSLPMAAFPCAQSQQTYLNQDGAPYQTGMTLRDWFAGQALAGLFRHVGWLNTCDGDEDEVASRAYKIADAMLKAREGK